MYIHEDQQQSMNDIQFIYLYTFYLYLFILSPKLWALNNLLSYSPILQPLNSVVGVVVIHIIISIITIYGMLLLLSILRYLLLLLKRLIRNSSIVSR